MNYYYDISFEQVNSEKWAANAVYIQALTDNRMRVIVVYGNKIFDFESEISLSDDQISMIREKLDLHN